MSKTDFSKSDSKKTFVALAIVAMFLAAMGVANVDAAPSPISLTVDNNGVASTATSLDVEEGNSVSATLTLGNTDTRYTSQEVIMYASLTDPDGTAGPMWDLEFQTGGGYALPDNTILISKGNPSTNVIVQITCGSSCSAGDDDQVILIFAKTDPVWSGGPNGGPGNSQCSGSTDCLTDTSSGLNTTSAITLTVTARDGENHNVDCEDVHTGGSIDVYQGIQYNWPYTLTNTGWNADSYTFTSTVTSALGADVDGWVVLPGLANPQALVGTESTGVSEVESSIKITPSLTARPGTYNIELSASNVDGSAESCNFDVIVPAPDLEIKETDIDFSHTSAWINIRGDSQKVTIYATVRNNGGNIDSSGASTNDVMVKFYADSAPVGSSQTLSLKHGEEETISVSWNPGRASTSEEVGIIISVKVDPTSDIEESDETNNEGNQFFKVVRTKSSTPSFYMGIFALIGSVAVAVMLSSYYRNKDLEE